MPRSKYAYGCKSLICKVTSDSDNEDGKQKDGTAVISALMNLILIEPSLQHVFPQHQEPLSTYYPE